MRSRATQLPSLGPRGEGWVVGQGILMTLVGILGALRLRLLPPNGGLRWLLLALGVVFLTVGAAVGARGARDLGPNITVLPRPRADTELVEAGIYARVRHPLYLAAILASIGWAAATASVPALLAAGGLTVWLDAKARREEAWLAERFAGYAAYRSRTARFLPSIY